MKIALVVPNFRWSNWDKNTLWHYIPYNLCLLASSIQDVVDVKIIDAYKENMSEEEFSDRIKGFDLVGITVLFDQYGTSGHIAARIAKQMGAKVVMGGVYATTNSEKVIQDENVDYVIIGEGEYVFKDLVSRLAFGEEIPKSTLIGNRIYSLDGLPLPAYQYLDMDKYINSAERKSIDSPRVFPYARIMTSRGCPIGCCFCQVETIAGSMFRPRSAENVLNEIQWLKDTYGIKSLIFDDDNLLHDKKRATDLFQGMIDRKLVLPWLSIGLAVFKLDEDLIKLMRRSGCEYFAVAIESGTKRVLKEIINKPISFDYAKKMVKFAREQGIYVAANFIIGFPTETWDEIRETIRFAEELDVDYAKIFHLVPLPHTRAWDLCERENAFNGNNDFVWSKGNIETKDWTANDLTILRAYEWDRINFSNSVKRERTRKMMGVTEEELGDIRRNTLRNACNLVGVK